jgi:hypothetical protein
MANVQDIKNTLIQAVGPDLGRMVAGLWQLAETAVVLEEERKLAVSKLAETTKPKTLDATTQPAPKKIRDNKRPPLRSVDNAG